MPRFLLLLLVFVLVAPMASAETIIEIHQDGVLVRRQVIETGKTASRPDRPKRAPWLKGAVLSPDTTWIVPGFRVDDTTPDGDSMFYSIRNARANDMDVNVTIEYFDEDNFSLDYFDDVVVPGNQTLTFNTRSNPLLVEPGGVSVGFIVIEADGPLGVDAFQVNFSEDFATGTAPPVLSDFCVSWLARFLTFGGDSGSQLVFLLSAPLGAESETPTIEGEVFNQAGMSINTFSVFTDSYVREIDAQDLVVGGQAFGTMEIDINLDAPLLYPSFLSIRHSAFQRFSVGLPAVCTGQILP